RPRPTRPPELVGSPADDRLAAAIAAIDAANADDPHTVTIDGVLLPKERAHAELVTEWVRRLDPSAGSAQLLAARANHLRRWVIRRGDYPEGRAGYRRWRNAQKVRQADEVAEILESVGYGRALIERVQQIIRKEGLHRDPAVQVHE